MSKEIILEENVGKVVVFLVYCRTFASLKKIYRYFFMEVEIGVGLGLRGA